MTGAGGALQAQSSEPRGFENLRRMLAFSALFHAAVILASAAAALFSTTVRLTPSAYQVDLVRLPSPPAPAETKVAPPPPKPEPPKAKKAKPSERAPAASKKPPRPAPPPKSAAPLAAVPPPSKEPPPDAADPEPAESKSAESAAIAPVEVQVRAGIESPDFKFPYYLDLIQRKIGTHWSPPPLEAVRGEREAVVMFELLANGKIADVSLRKSSGNAFFDQAALRAVYQANPLPPFPQGIPEKSLKVNFSFSLMKKG